MRMTFEEFKNEILSRKEEFLPETLKDAELEIGRSEKLNSSYDALIIHVPGQKVSASVNLNNLYEKNKDRTVSDVFADLTAAVHDMELDQVEKVTDNVASLENYENVKERLFIRCSNAEKNSEMLANHPHLEMGNLAMTVHVGIDWDGPDTPSYTATVNDAMLAKWDVSSGQLFADAIANSEARLPLNIRSLSEVMSEMMGGMPVPTGGPDLYVMGNTGSQFGAATVFYPNALNQAHEQLGEFYMLPSSIHEWLLLPEGMGPDLSDLEDMVKTINETEVSEADFLSNEIYHYDGNRMELAREYEARMGLDPSMDEIMNEPDYAPDEKAMTV